MLKAIFVLSAFLLLLACAAKNTGLPYSTACDNMKLEIQEKEKLDAKVKALRKQVGVYKQKNDTDSVAVIQQKLDILLINQKDLKKTLDETSQDCKPSLFEGQLPVGKPAE